MHNGSKSNFIARVQEWWEADAGPPQLAKLTCPCLGCTEAALQEDAESIEEVHG